MIEKKCPECKKLIIIDFIENNNEGNYYCSNCDIIFNKQGLIITDFDNLGKV